MSAHSGVVKEEYGSHAEQMNRSWSFTATDMARIGEISEQKKFCRETAGELRVGNSLPLIL